MVCLHGQLPEVLVKVYVFVVAVQKAGSELPVPTLPVCVPDAGQFAPPSHTCVQTKLKPTL